MKQSYPFQVMAKPVGSSCNLACSYCYYLDKWERPRRMDRDLLKEYVKQYIGSQSGPSITFGWQGGEPTLSGLDFFKEAVALQREYLPHGWRVENTFQTNGILLDDSWSRFFKENRFLVGISIDGPPNLHDLYRLDREGDSTSLPTIEGLHLLQRHGVEYSVLCVLHEENVQEPLKVYTYFKDKGITYLQFIPLVEHRDKEVLGPSLSPLSYAHFLITIFNQWLLHDIGEVSVQIFEESLRAWTGLKANLCLFTRTCGQALLLEADGSLYSCDHFVFPSYRLGHIRESSIGELATSREQQQFGRDKWERLPRYCRECTYLFICHGGCPKDRISFSPEEEEGLNYLCEGYGRFFAYIDPFMRVMAYSLKRGSSILLIRQRVREVFFSLWDNVGSSELCPCRSGREYRDCCLNWYREEVPSTT